MNRISRRRFLAGSIAAGAALGFSGGHVLGANEDIRLGFIGLGGRGSWLLNAFGGMDGVRVAGLAEPDRERLARAAELHPEAQAHTDLRVLLEQEDVDAVVIAACVHWNAVAACWAAAAGKHVFVEKPYSHNVWESRQVVDAARKYDRLIQVGTQHRSDPLQDELRAYLHSGELGDVEAVRALTYQLNNRGPIGRRPEPMTPPEHVDYDLWLGGAEDQPIYRDNFQYDWHWVWNTGGGDVINWGAHTLDDVFNVALQDPGHHPSACMAAGGRLLFDDAGDTPNAFFSFFEMGGIPVSYEVYHLPVARGEAETGNFRGVGNGFVMMCEGGYYAGGRGGGIAYDNEHRELRRFTGDRGEQHPENFLAALRSGKREELTAEVGTIHFSNSMCHLGNAALRAGGAYDRAQAEEVAAKHPSWQAVLSHFHERLEANGVDPQGHPDIRMSPLFGFDSQAEQFTGPHATPEAQAMLRRTYRAPYVLEAQA